VQQALLAAEYPFVARLATALADVAMFRFRDRAAQALTIFVNGDVDQGVVAHHITAHPEPVHAAAAMLADGTDAEKSSAARLLSSLAVRARDALLRFGVGNAVRQALPGASEAIRPALVELRDLLRLQGDDELQHEPRVE
jgi:hypothetical protein